MKLADLEGLKPTNPIDAALLAELIVCLRRMEALGKGLTFKLAPRIEAMVECSR